MKYPPFELNLSHALGLLMKSEPDFKAGGMQYMANLGEPRYAKNQDAVKAM